MRELAHVVREKLAAANVLAQRVLDEQQEDDGEDELRHHAADPVDDGFDRARKPVERTQHVWIHWQHTLVVPTVKRPKSA